MSEIVIIFFTVLFLFLSFDLLNNPVRIVLSHFSHVQLFVTLWTIAHQVPLSMGFSRQEYWSGFAMPFSRESSQLRGRIGVSYTAGRFFTLEPSGKPMASGKCPHQASAGRLICGLSKPVRASSSP